MLPLWSGRLRKISQIRWKERDHALFVAFAPVEAPRYVCATVVEHGGVRGGHGSEVAGPICRDILREAQRRDPVRRVPSGETFADLPIPIGPTPLSSNGVGG